MLDNQGATVAQNYRLPFRQLRHFWQVTVARGLRRQLVQIRHIFRSQMNVHRTQVFVQVCPALGPRNRHRIRRHGENPGECNLRQGGCA